MVTISTVVFFDTETTGLPHQERNRTKIVELSFLAVTRSDINRKDGPAIPAICKLNILFNPQKSIASAAAKITGLTNETVKYLPTFKEKFNTIKVFLEDLKKPVCLVAHNGNTFDYKILLAECKDVNVNLPEDLLCADSMSYFRQLFKKRALPQTSLPMLLKSKSPELTEDEDEWPSLNVTPEEFQEIDDLSSSTGLSFDVNIRKSPIKKEEKKKTARQCLKLSNIYTELVREEPENAHRAEDDCIMLLRCVRVCQNSSNASENFLVWLDDNCKPLKDITPLIRK